MSSKTIINKGNYSLETEIRNNLFNQYRAKGWEKEYQEYRKKWESYPKDKFISDYPLLVDIELASVCNLKCPMCYTISDEFKKRVNKKFFDTNLYKRIIDEISGKVPALRLSLRGESTLHPKFIECIKYAKDKGFKDISFLTNGSKLTKEYFSEIMNAGATWITISFDGLEEEYNRIRKPLIYEETLEKIKDIYTIKQDAKSNLPVIKIQGIWPAIKNNPERFYNTLSPYVDNVAFNPLVDLTKGNQEKVYLESFSCPMIYQRLVIGADGLVMLCANDEENRHTIGDINSSTVHKIWHGKEINKIRTLHKRPNGFLDVEVCKKCYLPVKMKDLEYIKINNRDITVQEYLYKEELN